MMGSRVSRASNRVESACTRNPLEQQTRHLPFGDQLHRLPGARPMQAPDASCYKRSHLRAIAFTTPPRYPSSRLSAAAAGAGICLSAPPTRPTRQSFSLSLTRKHHCFRPLRACSRACPASEVTSLSQPARTGHGKEASQVASYVGLCNVYWPCRDIQAYQHEHITSPSPHHVVDTIIVSDYHWI